MNSRKIWADVLPNFSLTKLHIVYTLFLLCSFFIVNQAHFITLRQKLDPRLKFQPLEPKTSKILRFWGCLGYKKRQNVRYPSDFSCVQINLVFKQIVQGQVHVANELGQVPELLWNLNLRPSSCQCFNSGIFGQRLSLSGITNVTSSCRKSPWTWFTHLQRSTWTNFTYFHWNVNLLNVYLAQIIFFIGHLFWFCNGVSWRTSFRNGRNFCKSAKITKAKINFCI